MSFPASAQHDYQASDHFIPLQLSTLPPSYENQMLPPSNVTPPLPPYNDPLPLPTMLINSSFISLPPSSAIPLSLSLPHITRHRMSESIGLEAHHYSNVPSRYADSGRQGPQSLACLVSDVIVHASCGQYALEYLCRTLIMR